jgi:hypothetical protein
MAGERSELWPSGALAWTAYLGWLPLVLAVAPPDVADVAGLAVQLYSSGSYPANVVALAAMTVGVVMLMALLAVAAEVAVTRAIRARLRIAAARTPADPAMSASGATLAGLSVVLLAATPVLVAAAWLALRLVEIGPSVYSAPGGEATVVPRLAMAALPQLVVVAAATMLGQAVGGTLLRRALSAPPERLGAALHEGLTDLRLSPARFVGIAAAGWLKDGLLLLGSWALLRTLWAPIGESLGPGLLTSPQLLLLLVGFVAIWLILLLCGGALHAFISAWWLFEGGERR